MTNELEQARITVDLVINNAGAGALRRLVDKNNDAVLRETRRGTTSTS